MEKLWVPYIWPPTFQRKFLPKHGVFYPEKYGNIKCIKIRPVPPALLSKLLYSTINGPPMFLGIIGRIFYDKIFQGYNWLGCFRNSFQQHDIRFSYYYCYVYCKILLFWTLRFILHFRKLIFQIHLPYKLVLCHWCAYLNY